MTARLWENNFDLTDPSKAPRAHFEDLCVSRRYRLVHETLVLAFVDLSTVYSHSRCNFSF